MTKREESRVAAGLSLALILGGLIVAFIDHEGQRPLTPLWKENPALIRAVCRVNGYFELDDPPPSHSDTVGPTGFISGILRP